MSRQRRPPFPFVVTTAGRVHPGRGASRHDASVVTDALSDVPAPAPLPGTELLLPTELLFAPHSHTYRRRLDLSEWSSRLNDATMVQVAPALPHVQLLALPHCPDVTMHAWAAHLPAATSLTSLNLAGNVAVNDGCMMQFARNTVSLTRLDVSDTSVTSAGMDAVTSVCFRLAWLSCARCKRVTTVAWLAPLRHLQHLDVSGCIAWDVVKDATTVACAGLLRQLHSLEVFHVSETPLDDALMRHMVRGGGEGAGGPPNSP